MNHHHDTAFIDSTVQEKNITYPTDTRLHKKIVKKLGLPLRQGYTLMLKGTLLWPAFPESSQEQEESPLGRSAHTDDSWQAGISKGKEHKKYEFGNKISIIRSAAGVIPEAMSFHNEYDGHTIEPH